MCFAAQDVLAYVLNASIASRVFRQLRLRREPSGKPAPRQRLLAAGGGQAYSAPAVMLAE
jgi:hypothetical protein